ncbi:MAG: cysteine--tRNA ligase [Verrucomicrobiae bacterium]|jgi:cysteinyl-tRNA synthetase|nr:cysteine--tRNA ligase [Verrucomicrobiae bacterium]
MLHFYNTLTRQQEHFTPGEIIRFYTCGPTVYDYAHIGNFRAYVFEDLLQRHLEARGNTVNRVMNLTDVDDKTIRGARREGMLLQEYTARYKKAFFEDCDALRLRPATSYPAATDPENIAAMIAMIQTLVEKGHAYQAEDHSVYFRIASFPRYGQLAHVDLDAQRSSKRIKNDEYTKEEIADFALWKAWNQEDDAASWESPWGPGRPGWHIECSAMATRLLGDTIDIHCGGVDNMFPHHEAEIAQCECVSGRTFVRLWMHCAHLMVDGMKMAKSAGNFYTVRDLMKRSWSGREIRYVLLSVHYRMPLNFTMEGLEAARHSLYRIDEWIRRLEEFIQHAADSAPIIKKETCFTTLEDFFIALDDDLNISAALAVLFDVIRESHRLLDQEILSHNEAMALLDWWHRVDSILAITPDSHPKEIPENVQQLVSLRYKARAAKNWIESDRLRDAIKAHGWIIKDTKNEQKLLPQESNS